MAELLKFPGSEDAALIVDRNGDEFELRVINRPPIPGLPKRFASVIEAMTEGMAAGVANEVGLWISAGAMVWEMERQIGPRPAGFRL